MQAGMSIIRMNFSHGSYEVCLGVILIALYSIGGDDETACKDVDDIVASCNDYSNDNERRHTSLRVCIIVVYTGIVGEY